MSKSIIIHEQGGPEVLKLEKVTIGSPGPKEIKIKKFIYRLNFIDTYHRFDFIRSNFLLVWVWREPE